MYMLNGDEVDLEAFLAANAEGFSKEQVKQARALKPGEQMNFGGGAAPLVTLRRVGEPTDAAPECLGHPAGPFDPPGETVYCDGSCHPVTCTRSCCRPRCAIGCTLPENHEGECIDQDWQHGEVA